MDLVSMAKDCGAFAAEIIDGSQIVMSAKFRDICASNQCGRYGKCWVCPPDIGEIDALMEKIRSFPKALLYQTVHELEDCFDIEGMQRGNKVHARVCQRVHHEIVPLIPGETLHLGCGGCHLCETCAKRDGLPCRHPEDMLPAMEGCGIDVSGTTRATSMKYINGQDTVTYFGIVLFHEV